jgi:uncharacterized protein YneR
MSCSSSSTWFSVALSPTLPTEIAISQETETYHFIIFRCCTLRTNVLCKVKR